MLTLSSIWNDERNARAIPNTKDCHVHVFDVLARVAVQPGELGLLIFSIGIRQLVAELIPDYCTCCDYEALGHKVFAFTAVGLWGTNL